MISQEVRDVIRKVPNPGKNAAVAVAKRGGLCFVSVYLLYRAVDMYDRAMRLNMDFKMKEFEWLQMELRTLIHLIHSELLPPWEYLSTAALRKITKEVIEKLSHYQAELKQLVRVINNDIKKGLSDRNWAAGYTLGSAAVQLGSVIVGNVPGAVVAFCAYAANLGSIYSFAVTIQKLQSLQYDVEMMCIETEEYRSLLQQKVTRAQSFDLFILLFATRVKQESDKREQIGQDRG